MYEKCNPSHPDKVADRIGGAILDLAYSIDANPKVALEILIGHGFCYIIAETSIAFASSSLSEIVHRIAGDGVELVYLHVPQDEHLAGNQFGGIRCGDNGIFSGTVVTSEQIDLTDYVENIYKNVPYDGKYIIHGKNIIACQSHTNLADFKAITHDSKLTLDVYNPLGDWTGGINVDTGAINRKLGSDMGDSVTGAGLHGKDLSKADVSVNIYAWLKAQICKRPISLYCAIGDEVVDGRPYSEIVDIARTYINLIGGFEKFAEWGLIRLGMDDIIKQMQKYF